MNDITLPRRFALERLIDQTGVSGTGVVLTGILLPSGKVVVEWRSPHQTMGIYNTIGEFLRIHVECHPDMNRILWYDLAAWHCFDCGCGGNDGNFCVMCGSPSTGYLSACEGFDNHELKAAESELEKLNREASKALSLEKIKRRRELVLAVRRASK